MKKLILSVGVILLTSSMTLTTTAFGVGTDTICGGTGVIGIENTGWIYLKVPFAIDVYRLRIGYNKGSEYVMKSLNKKDRDRAALAFEKAGGCSYTLEQPVCFVSETADMNSPKKIDGGYGYSKYTYTLSMATQRPHNIEVIMTSENDRDAVTAKALEYEKNGECIYSVSSL